MKILLSLILVTVMAGFYQGLAQTDTLIPVSEFDAPSANPWGLAHDGENLWISDDNTGKIYKTDQDGQVLDSIAINNAKIKGITFIDDTLWALNTMVMGDTVINTSSYPVYYLYKIDNLNGNKLDSIRIAGSATSLRSGDLWGLCYSNSLIYISFNGGWGSCLMEIDPATEEKNEICCTHLCGMTVFNDSIWAIRHNSGESKGDFIVCVNSDGTGEIKKYDFKFFATDLAYDGNNFWLCDRDSKKIKKMEELVLSETGNMLTNNKLKVYPNPAGDIMEIELPDNISTDKIRVTDIKGKIVKSIIISYGDKKCSLDITDINHGLYIIELLNNNRTITKKIIKN